MRVGHAPAPPAGATFVGMVPASHATARHRRAPAPRPVGAGRLCPRGLDPRLCRLPPLSHPHAVRAALRRHRGRDRRRAAIAARARADAGRGEPRVALDLRRGRRSPARARVLGVPDPDGPPAGRHGDQGQRARPRVPASVAGAVQSVVGLNTTAAPRPLLVRAPTRIRGARGRGAPVGCRPRRHRRSAAVHRRDGRRPRPAGLHRRSDRVGLRLLGAVRSRRPRRRRHRRGLRARARRPVRHRRLPVLLRHPRHDLLRAGRPGRRDRARQRRGGAGHREPHRPGAQRQRARLPGPELQLGRPGLGPLRHLQRDHQPGPRAGGHRLLGPVRGGARPGRRLRGEHAV